MSNETKFFDVECANDSAYDLKELRRLFKRILKKSNVEHHVYRMGGMIRLKVAVPRYMTMNFKALQEEKLTHRRLMLHEVAEDGTAKPVIASIASKLEAVSESASPTTIPVVTVITGSHELVALFPQQAVDGSAVQAVRSAA